MSDEAEQRLARIEETLKMLTAQMEDLFRLLDGRMQHQKDETDRRFQFDSAPYSRVK